MPPQTRKVTDALQIWRRWPEEIECDLLDAGLDIADWLQGTLDEHGRMKLSSRRLLVFLKKSDDESRFKTQALRDGDWSKFQKMIAATHLEVAKLRAAFVKTNGGEGEDVQYIPFLSPPEEAELIRERLAEDDGDSLDDMQDRLFGG